MIVVSLFLVIVTCFDFSHIQGMEKREKSPPPRKNFEKSPIPVRRKCGNHINWAPRHDGIVYEISPKSIEYTIQRSTLDRLEQERVGATTEEKQCIWNIEFLDLLKDMTLFNISNLSAQVERLYSDEQKKLEYCFSKILEISYFPVLDVIPIPCLAKSLDKIRENNNKVYEQFVQNKSTAKMFCNELSKVFTTSFTTKAELYFELFCSLKREELYGTK